jgi:hypothetical protein
MTPILRRIDTIFVESHDIALEFTHSMRVDIV